MDTTFGISFAAVTNADADPVRLLRKQMLQTAHMRLVPATVELARSEIADPARFAEILNATIPDNWPPDLLVDALPFFLTQLEIHSEISGWLTWYGIVTANKNLPDTLVASGGFTGFPENGAVEIGYSVLPQFQNRGYATEMVNRLTEWAFGQNSVRQVYAAVEIGNTASRRVLEKAGFIDVSEEESPNSLRQARMLYNGK